MQYKVSNPFVPPNCYRPDYIKGECELKNSNQRVGIVNYHYYEEKSNDFRCIVVDIDNNLLHERIDVHPRTKDKS